MARDEGKGMRGLYGNEEKAYMLIINLLKHRLYSNSTLCGCHVNIKVAEYIIFFFFEELSIQVI